MVEMEAVVSSNLRRWGYDPATQILRVEFHSGAVWDYQQVLQEEFDSLQQAPSKGSAFNSLVKSSHPGVRVEETPTRQVDLAVARGRAWCVRCGEEQSVHPAEFPRSGWPTHCGAPMTLASPAERRVVLPASTEAERQALLMANSPPLLLNRFKQALHSLASRPLPPSSPWTSAEVIPMFSSATLLPADYLLLGRTGPGIEPAALRWRARPRPDQPESYANRQTSGGVVCLVHLASGEEVAANL